MSIARIFHYRNDERVRKLKIEKIMLWFTLGIWVFLALFFASILLAPSYYSNTNVDYSELNQTERAVAYSIIDDLKVNYLHLAENIIFVKNQGEMIDGDTAGQNILGNIKILYDDYTESQLSMIVCHEILHSAVSLNYDLEEEIVYDIGKTGVCYL